MSEHKNNYKQPTNPTAILESFDGLIYVCSQDYKIEYMNKALIEKVGYDAVGEPCYKSLYSRDSTCPWCVNERVFNGEKVVLEIQNPKDSRWYHIVNTPIYQNNQMISKLALITDITDKKNAKKKEQNYLSDLSTAIEIVAHLSCYTTPEDLYKGIIKNGKEKFNIDGLGIWLIESKNKETYCVKGTFGIDEKGNIRDERNSLLEISINSATGAVLSGKSAFEVIQEDLLDDKAARSGCGWRIVVPLEGSDSEVIGLLRADILLDKAKPDDFRIKLLQSYGLVCGHLIQTLQSWERLGKEKLFLNSVFDAIRDGVSVLDKDLNILYVNSVIEEKYFYNMPLIGKKCYEAYHSRTDVCEPCPSLLTIKTGKPQQHTVSYTNRDGQILGWNTLYTFPIFDVETGQVKAVIEYVRDVTDKRVMEDKLKESEERYRGIVELAPIVVYAISGIEDKEFKPGEISSLNSTFEKLTGWKKEEWIGRHFTEIIHPDDLDLAKRKFNDVLNGKKTSSYELRIRSKSGVYLTGEFTSLPQIRDGRIVGKFGFCIDITARKSAIQILKRQASEIETIYSIVSAIAKYHTVKKIIDFTLKDVVRTVDADLGCIFLIDENKTTMTAFPYKMTNESIEDLNTNKMRIGEEFSGIVAETGEPLFVEDACIDSRRTRKFILDEGIHSLAVFPIKIKNEMLGTFTIGRRSFEQFTQDDINILTLLCDEIGVAIERSLLYENLLKSEKELEKKVQERTSKLKEMSEKLHRLQRFSELGQFSGFVSHQIRNPLTVIRNASEFLKKKSMPDEQCKDILDILINNVDRATEIVSSVLTFSRFQKPKKHIENINMIVKQAVGLIVVPGDIDIILNLDQHLKDILVDKDLILQAIFTLIQNSIEAMPSGGKCKISTAVSGNYTEIIISDTGVGIEKELLPKLFEPLFTTKTTGIGLGLVICKQIIESHNGMINIESQVGKGTSVFVKLPIDDEIT